MCTHISSLWVQIKLYELSQANLHLIDVLSFEVILLHETDWVPLEIMYHDWMIVQSFSLDSYYTIYISEEKFKVIPHMISHYAIHFLLYCMQHSSNQNWYFLPCYYLFHSDWLCNKHLTWLVITVLFAINSMQLHLNDLGDRKYDMTGVEVIMFRKTKYTVPGVTKKSMTSACIHTHTSSYWDRLTLHNKFHAPWTVYL